MTEKTYWESFKAEGANIAEKLNEVIREGNARRVIVEYQGKTIAEFPLTVGVIGAVIAPDRSRDRRHRRAAEGLHDPGRAP